MTGPDLLERIDRAIAELQAIRAEVAALDGMPRPDSGELVDEVFGGDGTDLAEVNLLDTTGSAIREIRSRNGAERKASDVRITALLRAGGGSLTTSAFGQTGY